MPTSLFDALFALLIEKGPTLEAHSVQAVLTDPECMASRVAELRQQINEEMGITHSPDESSAR